MINEITKGIQISVRSIYNGTIYRGYREYFSFSYFISIKNKSQETVQLLERKWVIFDSLNDTEIVEGEGVVGQTPTLVPNDAYHYKSNCFLTSSIGAMNGHYKMINTKTNEKFLVKIPTFQLTTPPTLN